MTVTSLIIRVDATPLSNAVSALTQAAKAALERVDCPGSFIEALHALIAEDEFCTTRWAGGTLCLVEPSQRLLELLTAAGAWQFDLCVGNGHDERSVKSEVATVAPEVVVSNEPMRVPGGMSGLVMTP